MNTVLSTKPSSATLRRVEEVTAAHVEDGLTSRLAELRLWIAADLVDVDAALSAMDRVDTPMHGAARHLLELGGKRLRPLCVALAARAGAGFDRTARDLAVAAELVHSATLLHDDVVDLGDRRRGAPTSRVVYGNIASIYAGDWLLVEALRRIRSTGHHDLLDRALDTLDQMLGAEALQLALRGTVPARASYFEVVEGKTASLFRWAMAAGARAGGLDRAASDALERYGRLVGVAFQVMDDVLDVAGDPGVVGKAMFGDLREGKITFPLLLAVERDAAFGGWLRGVVGDASVAVDDAVAARVTAALRDTGAVADARALARQLSDEALGCLEAVPTGRARDALADVAAALVDRRK
jgi:octaprenyl-diphosphate synthase